MLLARPPDRICDQTGLLFVLGGQMEPLAGLCNHLRLGKISGCVSWQDRVTGWTPQLGRIVGWTSQDFLVG